MRRLLPFLSGLALFWAIRGGAAPPFSGTIFLDPDIIRSTDPSALASVEDSGRGLRLMFDRRVNNWVNLDAYLFDASYDDGLRIEMQVNPEFGGVAAARTEARRYAEVIGRLPTGLRSGVATSWIHRGTQPFGGGNSNLLIHTGQAAEYAASGILEETLVHEAAHSTLDPLHARASGWLAAQQADPEFISTYARDNPTREDIAESYLPYLAVRHRRDRISGGLADTILRTMPHRIAYFDGLGISLYPIVPMQVSVEWSGGRTMILSWPSPSTGWHLEHAAQAAGGVWSSPPEPVADDGNRRSVPIEIAPGQRYFRLAR